MNTDSGFIQIIISNFLLKKNKKNCFHPSDVILLFHWLDALSIYSGASNDGGRQAIQTGSRHVVSPGGSERRPVVNTR